LKRVVVQGKEMWVTNANLYLTSELAAACISDVKIFIREGSAVPAVGIEERSRDFSFSVLFAPRTLLPKTG